RDWRSTTLSSDLAGTNPWFSTRCIFSSVRHIRSRSDKQKTLLVSSAADFLPKGIEQLAPSSPCCRDGIRAKLNRIVVSFAPPPTVRRCSTADRYCSCHQ